MLRNNFEFLINKILTLFARKFDSAHPGHRIIPYRYLHTGRKLKIAAGAERANFN